MSKILQQTIVPIAAVIGSQLPGLLFQPQPGQSSSSCLQWASNAIDGASYNLQRTFSPPQVPAGMTEGEYNQLREVFKTDDIRVSAPPSVSAATGTPGTTAGGTEAPTALDGTASSLLPKGMTEREYQAERHALSVGGQ